MPDLTDRGTRARGSVVALGPIVIVGAGVVLLLTFLDRAEVSSARELGAVSFGLPFPWITQSQSIDPPAFPWRARVLSPWENPTQVSFLALAVDLVLVLAALGVLLLVVRQRARRP